jgi:hypothetical protein
MKALVTTLILLVSASIYAQNTETKTNKNKLFVQSDQWGGFGGISIKALPNGSIVRGGEGAAIFNNFYFGGFGHNGKQGTVTIGALGEQYTTDLFEGGLMIGAVSNTNNTLALYAEMKIGRGKMHIDNTTNPSFTSQFMESFNSLAPAVGVSIKAASFVSLRMNLGYFHHSNISFQNIDLNDARGLNFGVSLLFGSF